MIELYTWEPNTFFLKPLIALNEKGLDYKAHFVDYTSFAQLDLKDAKANLEARHNPENEGPILVHDGKVITESFFMISYIDEAFPDQVPLHPGNPEGNWRVRMWARFFGESTGPAVTTLGCKKYLVPLLKERRINDPQAILDRMETQERKLAWKPALEDSYTDEIIDESKRKASFAVQRVEEHLANSPWLAGPNYSLADIEGFAMTMSFPKLVPELCNKEKAPRMTEWMAKVKERPAVQKALATSKSGKPDEAFVPGPEHARWG
jgi:glutathione S-transferase